MGDRRVACRVLEGRPEGWRPHGTLGVDGRIISKSIFKKRKLGSLDWIDLVRIGTGGGLL
jgi:hypothetical protein